ncbi:MAG: phospho-N-acetylmuramoyl-pentapeptide-transferase [Flavobacteriales bacterium]|jgi:phospho-N-acetylmuramoyl-pentapeptide-transferase|nr:phospho-N-acetylmuramoyl-pentapeptide-transferase [Flavobacteriales bacterium]
MLFHLFKYLNEAFDLPGSGMFQYISFRAALAMILSLIVSIGMGKAIIGRLQKLQIGEIVRDLGLEGQMQKQGTPTMGGVIILAAILIPTLLLADLGNIYVQTMIVVTVFLGTIGFIDDHIKVFKKNKDGLAGKFKVFGQVSVSAIVASMLWFSPQGRVSESAITTMPFMKNNAFDYAWLVDWATSADWAVYAVFLLVVIFIVTAVSNGANLTDGMDGLATGTSAIIGVTLAALAYVSGNTIFADYLGVMYIPNSGELVVFIAAFIGACIGFLWYNAFPAQVFMGDTGSLALGGIIATFAIAIRKELMIPVLCGVFLIENLSVVLQVSWFKYTKKKYGEGRRIFLMSPLHHHYQKQGMPESKITARFWIVGVLLALVTVASLKIR